MATTRVWSLSQRLLHWGLAISVVAAFATHEGGGPWHEWTGYAALAIALFRIVLGAWMVLTLLATTALASLSGWLYTTDQFWGVEWVEQMHSVFGHAFIPLVALHLCGVAYTSWRHRENLVKSMLTGDKSAQ